MATEPTTWVSLERIKQELRLSLAVTDQDVMLVGHIDAAIAVIEREIGIPLLEKTEKRLTVGKGGNVPLSIGFVSFLRAVPRIDYWDQAGSNEQPDGSMTQAFDTRAESGANPESWRKRYLVLPPSTGFPSSRTGEYRVTIQSGMEPSEFPNIVQILIAIVREYYTGGSTGGNNKDATGKPSLPIMRMIEPLRQYALPDHGTYPQLA